MGPRSAADSPPQHRTMTSEFPTVGIRFPSEPDPDARPATKIVATIGPGSENYIGEMIDAGLSVARINFSHGNIEEHDRYSSRVIEEAEKRGKTVGLLGDLPGPKLRMGRFDGAFLDLEEGQEVKLSEGNGVANKDEVLFDFPGFLDSMRAGQRVYLADGAAGLVIKTVRRDGAIATVRRGGRIGDRKGVHLPDARMEVEVPTQEDRQYIQFAAEKNFDLLGISFVARPEEIERVRGLAPGQLLVAKIERRAALENIDGILRSADGIMVARGDLGVEMALEQLPLIQKSLTQAALRVGKFTITATEMLESMVTHSRPTRAEVSDVANAVLDGTDAVMLSAETAVGAYPVEAVKTMSQISCAVESSDRYHELDRVAFRTNESTFSNATTMAAAQAADALNINKIICFTETGNTARLLSRYRPTAEVVALSPNQRSIGRMTVLAHVRPVRFKYRSNLEEMLAEAQNLLIDQGICEHGEEVVFVAGVPAGVALSTNVMKLHRIGSLATFTDQRD